MLDIKLLRDKPDWVKERLATRNVAPDAVDTVLHADNIWRTYIPSAELLQAEIKRESNRIAQLMREGNKADAEAARARTRDMGHHVTVLNDQARFAETERDNLLFTLPNLPADDVPPGNEDQNIVVQTVGNPPSFDFPPKAHWDIAADLGLIDFPRGAKLAGSGFALYRGAGALLERGLIQFMLDFHCEKHGYTEWSTPFFLLRESMKASCHLAKFTPEMYHDAESDLFALPTAEPALVNIHRDEILDARTFPLKYVAYSPCWRREAGAAGKDTRGLLRVHQFDKVEMVKITLPETSYAELDSLVTDATDILNALGLSYRVKLLAAGDLSFAAAKCFDIETYAPGVGAWLEVSSCSNCEDFQARQGSIRFRREPKAKPEYAHLLNGSGLALPRIVATLLETYQMENGSILLPPALRPYLGNREFLTKAPPR